MVISHAHSKRVTRKGVDDGWMELHIDEWNHGWMKTLQMDVLLMDGLMDECIGGGVCVFFGFVAVKQKKRQSEEEEEKKGEWGSVQMVHDDDLQAAVVEVRGDGRTTSITCPAPSSRTAHLHLAITLPVFVLVVKHLRFFYSYQVEVLDDSGVKRVFRFTNTQVHPPYFLSPQLDCLRMFSCLDRDPGLQEP